MPSYFFPSKILNTNALSKLVQFCLLNFIGNGTVEFNEFLKMMGNYFQKRKVVDPDEEYQAAFKVRIHYS